MRAIHKAQKFPKRIVFPEGMEEKVLRASQIILDEEIATPILLGDKETIREKIKMLDLDLNGVEIIDPVHSQRFDVYMTANVTYDCRRFPTPMGDESRLRMRRF